ncbi:hypothetical protein [Pectobacterium aroidearum]|uniref:hypothetical protein n=1 Tax=Pectobacterium aroidearum TaxID=1201031 RepID=UPI002113B2E1|nr:hypothetical protein [Pectobacterium aroidearum]UUE44940.1 hypothetical protein L0Y28_21010 [Pectobacterium aroidearum]UUE49159.1 hypothetical protein L0Y23_20890 [Pectobacterium aroidearum]UUE53363.1 hypothetical protein L0Y30_21010 [Pectobacterium aroidearum]UUE61774.1 hypothetical protein L0Y29_21010 [Pectobacterium aroidearum]UUE65998.1 hypothetical protein L0Y22_21005 [Pectobacterium aroidearum]
MTTQPNPSRELVEQLLGKYLLIAGEIDMFITMSQSLFTLSPVSDTWIKKSLADKLKWYGNNLDQAIPEHKELVRLISIFDSVHRPLRNNLAHSGLCFDVDTSSFKAMNADGSADSIPLHELQQKVAELGALNGEINSAIAKSASAYQRLATK